MPLLTSGTVVSVEVPPSTIPSVEKPSSATASVAVLRGPRGLPGPTSGVEIAQTAPASTWTLTVPPGFGRRPAVAVYVDGALVLTDVVADATTVTITFPGPTAGIAVLT